MTVESTSLADDRRKIFVLQEIQPGLLGLMDGSVSTLAPIFATAGLTGRPPSAFFVGLAASLGAAISMGLSEALSDDGSAAPKTGAKATAISHAGRTEMNDIDRRHFNALCLSQIKSGHIGHDFTHDHACRSNEKKPSTASPVRRDRHGEPDSRGTDLYRLVERGQHRRDQ